MSVPSAFITQSEELIEGEGPHTFGRELVAQGQELGGRCPGGRNVVTGAGAHDPGDRSPMPGDDDLLAALDPVQDLAELGLGLVKRDLADRHARTLCHGSMINLVI